MYNKFKTQLCDLSYAKMFTVLASAENSYLTNVLQNIKEFLYFLSYSVILFSRIEEGWETTQTNT